MSKKVDPNTPFCSENVCIGYQAGYSITGDDVVMIRDRPRNAILICAHCGGAKMEKGDPHKCANCGAVAVV